MDNTLNNLKDILQKIHCALWRFQELTKLEITGFPELSIHGRGLHIPLKDTESVVFLTIEFDRYIYNTEYDFKGNKYMDLNLFVDVTESNEYLNVLNIIESFNDFIVNKYTHF